MIVIDSDKDNDKLVIGEENMEKIVSLHHSTDHLDLLLDWQQYISLEQEEVAVNNRINFV